MSSMYNDRCNTHAILANNIVTDCALLVQGQECSNFLAGHALWSTNRFVALQETGVMGVVCRHEFPLCFINLCYGER